MDSTPSVSVCTSLEGETIIRIRQNATDGQYSVDICITVEQFSGLMAVLRGLDMYFMDMDLRKTDSSLQRATLAEVQTSSDHKDIGTQTATTRKTKKRILETIPEDEEIYFAQV